MRARRRRVRGAVLAIGAIAPWLMPGSVQALDRSNCFAPTIGAGVPVRFDWRLPGGGDLASSASYYAMCFARKNPPPGDPFGGDPIFLTPEPIDTIAIFDRNKPGFMEPGETPGPVNGTITSGAATYRGLGVVAFDSPAGRSDITLSVGGVLHLTELFSGFGVRDTAGASNLRITGSAITSPLVSLTGTDVQGSLAVSSELPTAGFTIASPDIRIFGRVTAWDAFVGFGAGSSGTLALQPGSTLALTGSAQLMFVGFGGSGTLDVGAGALLQSGGLFAGILPGSNGTISVHDGGRIEANLTPTARMEIGRRGIADVTIGPGSEIVVKSEIQIGSEAGGDGFVRVDAGGTLKTEAGALRIGGIDQGLGTGGTGRLVINGGTFDLAGRALVGASEGGTGTLEITGGEATIKERLVIGHAGEGTLKVSGDGKLTITTPLDGEGLRIGRWATGKGTVELSGVDATVEGLGNRVIVGLFGEGTLKINDGFLLDVPGADVILGQEAGASGTVIVSDPFSVLRAKNITIGESGTGSLQVLDGGSVVISGIATMGETPPSSGASSEVIVSGEGSVFEVGKLEIGSDSGARANVVVSDGGLIRITGSSDPLRLGVEAGTFGRLVIDGAESRIETPAGLATFVFGERGEGVVEFRGGANAALNALELGKESTGKGTLRVDGADTRVKTGALTVGGRGEGLVEVTGGAVLEVRGATVIGKESTATLTQSGRIDVIGNDGPGKGSKLEIAGDLTVGERAIGLLKVAEGGQVVVSGDLLVGAERDGVGRIEITGSPSGGDHAEIKVSGAITLGRNGGQGTLVIKDDGRLSGITLSPEKIVLAEGEGSFGRIELDSASLTSRDLVVGAGGEARIEIKGSSTLRSTGRVEIGGVAGIASGDGIVRVLDDSQWLVTGAFVRAPLVIGNERPGDVFVGGGGRLEAGAMRLGTSDAARGALNVSGSEATIDNKLKSGEQVVVGYDSAGDNRVVFAGKSWTITSLDGDVAELVIGRKGAGRVEIDVGVLTVGDANATSGAPPENGRIKVGVDGRATLKVGSRGSVGATAIEIGANDEAKLVLDGGTLSARKVTLDGALAEFSVNAGARATVNEIDSRGVVRVEGADSRLKVEETLKLQGVGAKLEVLAGGGVDAGRLHLKDGAEALVASGGGSGEGLQARSLQVEGSKLVVKPGGSLFAINAAVGGAGAMPRARLEMEGGEFFVGETLRVGFVGDAGSGLATPGAGDLIVGGAAGVTVNSMLFVGSLGHLDTVAGRTAVGAIFSSDVPIGQLHVGAGGTLRGCSRISAARVVVLAGGTADPGCSPGRLVVDGDFVIEAGGKLHVEIAGLGAGEHDVLEVLGDLVIEDGAVLVLDFLDGFVPDAGDLVDFVSFGGSLTGGFASVLVQGLAPDWDYALGLSSDGIRLTSISDAAPSDVPTPSALAALLACLALLAALRQRRSATPAARAATRVPVAPAAKSNRAGVRPGATCWPASSSAA